MYERFTSEARDAVMEAQTEARALAHDHVGTEHLLLGVLRLPVGGDTRLPVHEPAGIAPRVLADLGITLDRARAEVRRLLSRQEPGLTDADAEALRSIGIDVDEIRRRVEEDFGPGALDAPVGITRRRRSADPAAIGPVFTSEAKHALELAVRESMRLGDRHIGAEHLLLAIAAPDGLSADILQSLGTDPAVVRTRVLEQRGRAA